MPPLARPQVLAEVLLRQVCLPLQYALIPARCCKFSANCSSLSDSSPRLLLLAWGTCRRRPAPRKLRLQFAAAAVGGLLLHIRSLTRPHDQLKLAQTCTRLEALLHASQARTPIEHYVHNGDAEPGGAVSVLPAERTDRLPGYERGHATLRDAEQNFEDRPEQMAALAPLPAAAAGITSIQLQLDLESCKIPVAPAQSFLHVLVPLMTDWCHD